MNKFLSISAGRVIGTLVGYCPLLQAEDCCDPIEDRSDRCGERIVGCYAAPCDRRHDRQFRAEGDQLGQVEDRNLLELVAVHLGHSGCEHLLDEAPDE